jgi:hypothetical protein
MRRKLIVVMLAALSIPTALMLPTALLVSSSALAQVGGIGSLTPGIGATSPLGGVSGSPNSPLGIPLGATELSSPGLSPVPTAALGGDSTCSATSGMSGTNSIYDGGGIAVGGGANSTPMSASCGANANGIAPSSPSQLSASPSGIAQPGIPLGSFELSNAGVSPTIVIPTPQVQSAIGGGIPCSTSESMTASNSC